MTNPTIQTLNVNFEEFNKTIQNNPSLQLSLETRIDVEMKRKTEKTISESFQSLDNTFNISSMEFQNITKRLKESMNQLLRKETEIIKLSETITSLKLMLQKTSEINLTLLIKKLVELEASVEGETRSYRDYVLDLKKKYEEKLGEHYKLYINEFKAFLNEIASLKKMKDSLEKELEAAKKYRETLLQRFRKANDDLLRVDADNERIRILELEFDKQAYIDSLGERKLKREINIYQALLQVLKDLIPMEHKENENGGLSLIETTKIITVPRSPFRASFLPLKRKSGSLILGTPKIQRIGIFITLNAFVENEILIRNRSDRVFDLNGWTIESVLEKSRTGDKDQERGNKCGFPKGVKLEANSNIKLLFVQGIPRAEPYHHEGALVIEGPEGFFNLKEYDIVLKDDTGADICNLRHIEAHTPFF